MSINHNYLESRERERERERGGGIGPTRTRPQQKQRCFVHLFIYRPGMDFSRARSLRGEGGGGETVGTLGIVPVMDELTMLRVPGKEK